MESAHENMKFKTMLDLMPRNYFIKYPYNVQPVSTYSRYHHTLKLQTDNNLRHIMPAALSTAFLTYALFHSMRELSVLHQILKL